MLIKADWCCLLNFKQEADYQTSRAHHVICLLWPKSTYDTQAACTSPSAPAPHCIAQGQTWASSGASVRPDRTSRCSHSTPTRATACRGWNLWMRGWAQTFRRCTYTHKHTVLLVDYTFHLRHSGIMHFSTSATSVLHIDPSMGGIFTMRSRLLMPKPHVTLQGSHSAHSVTTQLLGAAGGTKVSHIVSVSPSLVWSKHCWLKCANVNRAVWKCVPHMRLDCDSESTAILTSV